MISIKERQTRLAYLGYYTGKLDGIEGKKTKEGYKKLQDAFFTRSKDKDGVYGKNTETLLINAYNFKLICKHFKLSEFKCHCNGKYCTGYPHIIEPSFLANLELFRTKIGEAMICTSGVRCKNHNANVKGGSKSRHLIGKALDFYTKKSKNSISKRKEYINSWINTYKESRYGYTNGYANLEGKLSYPTGKSIGNAIHIDIK